MDRKTLFWILVVYLLISFVPALSLTSLLGKMRGGGSKGGPGQ
jgi:hypothetical protein